MSEEAFQDEFNKQVIDEIIRLDYERTENEYSEIIDYIDTFDEEDIEDITIDFIEKTIDYYYSLINTKSTESDELQKYKTQFDNMKNTTKRYFNEFELNEYDKEWFYDNCIFKECIALVNLFNESHGFHLLKLLYMKKYPG